MNLLTNRKTYSIARFIFSAVCTLGPLASGVAVAAVDNLQLGVPASEQAHEFQEAGSETIAGGLGEPARHLLPKGDNDWEGGTFSFTMKVDPGQQNYFTVKLWGSQLRYGNYLIGMNCTKNKTYSLNIPTEANGFSVPDLISAHTIALTDKIEVPPQSTMILYLKTGP